MSTSFQNRLVGSIVFIAVAVIVLPELLDGEKGERSDHFLEVPSRPKFEHKIEASSQPDDFEQKVVILEPIEDEEPDDARLVSTNISASQNAGATPTEENPTALTPGAETPSEAEPKAAELLPELQPVTTPIEAAPSEPAVAWVVQLGSFSNKDNVDALLRKLRDAGYASFSRPIKTKSGKALLKVFVGPDVNKERLESVLPHLKELTTLTGKVTKFTPVK